MAIFKREIEGASRAQQGGQPGKAIGARLPTQPAPIYQVTRREAGMYEVLVAFGTSQRRAGMVVGGARKWAAEGTDGRSLGWHQTKKLAALALVRGSW